jgi:hypothetical protein
MTEDNKRVAPETDARRGREEMSEAEIDRNLAETFPASDPPSWTLGTNHQQETQPPPAEPPTPNKSE